MRFHPPTKTALASEFSLSVANEHALKALMAGTPVEASQAETEGQYVKLAFAKVGEVVITAAQAAELMIWLSTAKLA